MLCKGQTVINWMEQLAPRRLAVPDDKIGLQLGTLEKEITGVLVTLDVTDQVVNEAIQIGANLIIAHHAIIYRPLTHLRTDMPSGKLYEKLIKHGIAVYVTHTNYDSAIGGMNDIMAEALGLLDQRGINILEETYEDKLRKLVAFVPETHFEIVQQALFAAGAGHIGDYSHCSFSTKGTGTFKPLKGADPFIGQMGHQSKVDEVRVETIVPESLERKVIQALLHSHPYEEPAYDLYSVDKKGMSYGLGRVGRLSSECTLRQLVDQVKLVFAVGTVRVVGDLKTPIHKVAVLGGAGSRYWKHASFKGADVLITGDIDYHSAHDALAAGLCIIDPGHNAEKIFKPVAANFLQKLLTEHRYSTVAMPSRINTEPFQFI